MPQPLIADLPPDMDLDGGYQIRITALNPSSGAVVSGVTVSNVMILAEAVGTGSLADGGFVPLPLLTPETP